MFQLILPKHKDKFDSLFRSIDKKPTEEVATHLQEIIDEIRHDIPEKKRISYGRYSVIKKLGIELFPLFNENNTDVFRFGENLYNYKETDPFVRSLGVQLISIWAEKSEDPEPALEIFEKAATDDSWELRECSSGFIRKLIKKFPERMEQWYLMMVTSDNFMARRFASESIRPVADNQWFKKNPEFCFKIISHLYSESKDYPRSSVGNNLSDWSRIDPERVYGIVKQLVESGNKNSFWIANRACRNLVKKEPIRVMNLLGIDMYKYKTNIYHRKDFE